MDQLSTFFGTPDYTSFTASQPAASSPGSATPSSSGTSLSGILNAVGSLGTAAGNVYKDVSTTSPGDLLARQTKLLQANAAANAQNQSGLLKVALIVGGAIGAIVLAVILFRRR